MSTKGLVGEEVDEGKDEKEGRLQFFEKSIFEDIYYTFLDYTPLSDNNNIKKESLI